MRYRSKHLRLTSCEWKAKYPDALTADAARMEKQKSYGRRLGMYLCRFCYGWHLTKG